MDIIVLLSAMVAMALSVVGFVIAPFYIGKPRQETVYTASSYLWGMFQIFIMVILSGRAFGWW